MYTYLEVLDHSYYKFTIPHYTMSIPQMWLVCPPNLDSTQSRQLEYILYYHGRNNTCIIHNKINKRIIHNTYRFPVYS